MATEFPHRKMKKMLLKVDDNDGHRTASMYLSVSALDTSNVWHGKFYLIFTSPHPKKSIKRIWGQQRLQLLPVAWRNIKTCWLDIQGSHTPSSNVGILTYISEPYYPNHTVLRCHGIMVSWWAFAPLLMLLLFLSTPLTGLLIYFCPLLNVCNINKHAKNFKWERLVGSRGRQARVNLRHTLQLRTQS